MKRIIIIIILSLIWGSILQAQTTKDVAFSVIAVEEYYRGTNKIKSTKPALGALIINEDYSVITLVTSSNNNVVMASECEEVEESVKNGVYIITISGIMVDYNGYIYAWTLYMNSAGSRAFAFTDSKLNTVKLYLKDFK